MICDQNNLMYVWNQQAFCIQKDECFLTEYKTVILILVVTEL